MSAVTISKKHTPDELLRMPDGDRYELLDGQLVERAMSTWSSYVAGRVYARLDVYCQLKQLGWLFPEGTSYQCFAAKPERVRKPDVSFIRGDRMTPEQARTGGHILIAPDLAIEIISPNDLAYDIAEKVGEFLDAGTELAWAVNPVTRSVAVYQRDGKGSILNEHDEIDGGGVLPGFCCQVAEFFSLPAGVRSVK
jgi:Uma2 family endonuclease